MSRRIVAVASWIFFGSTGSQAFGGGSDEGMKFADIDGMDRVSLASRSAGFPARVISGEEVPRNRIFFDSNEVANAFVSDTRVSIDVTQLLVQARMPDSVMAQLAQHGSAFRMQVAGRWLELLVVDSVFDPSYEAFHLSALVLNGEGTARFTVSENALVFVGTVQLDDTVYRIRSAGVGMPQNVLKVLSGRDGQYLTVDAIDSVSRLEARHVQMAMVADMVPEYFNTNDRGSVNYVRSGNIGRIRLYQVGQSPLEEVLSGSMREEVQAFVRSLAPATRLDDGLSLELESVSGVEPQNDNVFVITFHQVIEGIRVGDRGFLVGDPITGDVETFSGNFYRRSDINGSSDTWLVERDALTLALDAIAQASGESGNEVTVAEARFLYWPRDDGRLEPVWEFELSVGPRPFAVRISALTGRGQLLDAVLGAKHATCVGNTPTSATCDTPVYVENSSGTGRICYPGSTCTERHANVWDKVQEIEQHWSDYSQGFCCATGFPNGSFPNQTKIVVDSDFQSPPAPAGAAAYYSSTNATVALPPPGEKGLAEGVDPTAPGTQEIVSHEWFHVYEHRANPAVLADTHWIPDSLDEGFADVNAVLENGALAPQGDWIFGDGEFEGGGSDLTTPRTLGSTRSRLSSRD